MARRFIEADHEAVLEMRVRIGDVLPWNHLARFMVRIIEQLDFSSIDAGYGEQGAPAYAPELLFGILVYGYASGVFSLRQLEKESYESVPFIYIAGGKHPDHDTINTFRGRFLPEIEDLFVPVLLLAHMVGLLKLGNVSLEGSKIQADASKSKAVSGGRKAELEAQLRQEVQALMNLAEASEEEEWPDGFDPVYEIQLRERHLAGLAEAKAVLESRAQERYEEEMAEDEAKMAERQAKYERTGKKPGGRPPQPPTPAVQEKDQYNFTDPESRIMKNGNNSGFEQSYNAQVAVDQERMLIVANTLSNHPTDPREALPTIDAIAPQLGTPEAAALDNGYCSSDNIAGLEARGIDPSIATGRDLHHASWSRFFEVNPEPPADVSPKLKMAYKLKTDIGHAIYRLRKSTVEPVIGIIKELLGFRQFSLRGLDKAAGEWMLVCLAFNLKRLHVLGL
jgi:transposase